MIIWRLELKVKKLDYTFKQKKYQGSISLVSGCMKLQQVKIE